MQKLLVMLLWALSIGIPLRAQITDTLHQDVAPKGGVNNLAVLYYGIDFTKAQRELLKDVEVEFIFQVDTAGKPTLSAINGVQDAAILDSLVRKTAEAPDFQPMIRNGVPQPSIYFMKLVFPNYRMTDNTIGFIQSMAYREAQMEDFEYIHRSDDRLDIVFGGMVNQFIGNPAQHLGLGGGMKMEIALTGKHQLVYGLDMNFYGNKLKKDYPVNTSREQFKAPPTLFIGLFFGKWIDKFCIQAEINYTVQNITERVGDDDPEWVQLRGWSPGLVLHYPIRMGRERPSLYYGAPTIMSQYFNLSLGVRPVFLSLREATGGMLELGISYRLSNHVVKEYKLK